MVKFRIIKNNYNTPSTRETNPQEQSVDMNDIELLRNSFYDMYDLKDAYKFIDSNKNIEELDLNLFKLNDYYLKTGKLFNFNSYINNLKSINHLDIKCAPKLIDAIALENNQDVVLITQIPNSAGAELVKYNNVRNTIPVSTKRSLVEDFTKLAKEKKFNPVITDSIKNWLVVPKTNQIYIDDWSILKEFDRDNKQNTLKRTLEEMCGLIY